MANVKKIIIASAIGLLVLIYLVVGVYMYDSTQKKFSELETQISVNAKKRDYLIEQTISLQAIKTNMEAELSLEKEKAAQQKLLDTINKLKEEDRRQALEQATLQQAAIEQQRLQDQIALAELQRQQLIAQAKKSTSSSSTSTGTTSTTTTTTGGTTTTTGGGGSTTKAS
jgi:hypothetical protein